MEFTLDYLKKLADKGLITETGLIQDCERNPKLLKTININDFISQPGIDLQLPEVVEPEVVEPEESQIIVEEIDPSINTNKKHKN